jgi:hypothetical protein
VPETPEIVPPLAETRLTSAAFEARRRILEGLGAPEMLLAAGQRLLARELHLDWCRLITPLSTVSPGNMS